MLDAEGSRFTWIGGAVIMAPADAPLPVRLLHISEALEEIILRFAPESCAMESVYYHKNPKSSLTLGQAQAAAILAAAHRGLPVDFYSPSEVKQALTGGGRAAKQQVRFMVERILGLRFEDETDDLSDALAVAICHAGRRTGVAAGV